MNTLYLCGAGNSEGVRLAMRIAELRKRWNQVVLLDDERTKQGKSILGVPIVGGFDLLEAVRSDDEVQNLVTRTARGRMAARAKIARHCGRFATLLSPDVDVLGVEIRGDATVYHNATLGPESILEAGSVVWMGAVVGHESFVGQGSIVASNSVLNARVTLGQGVYVGTNATVLPEVSIGDWATVGAGSVVMSDVPAGETAIGIPAEVVDFGRVEEKDTSGLTEVEGTILAVFRSVMKDSALSAEDNFFYCGGTSLDAMRLKTEVEQLTGETLPLVEIMRHPTARGLAQFLLEPVAAA